MVCALAARSLGPTRTEFNVRADAVPALGNHSGTEVDS
jgi:hypothetical protein